MIVDELKKRAAAAVKQGDNVARDVLRLALGEIQMAEVRKGEASTEEDAAAAIRKLIKSNDETLKALSESDERVAVLKHENDVLAGLLPAQLSVEQIAEALGAQAAAIKAAGNEGQAIGIAMKHLKAAGADVKGSDVGLAVKLLRTT